jgi:sRNA-binding protein
MPHLRFVREVAGRVTHCPAHLAAVVAGATRHALDGSVAGEVTEAQAAIARAEAERQATQRASFNEPTAIS